MKWRAKENCNIGVYVMELFSPKSIGGFQLLLDAIEDHFISWFCFSIGLWMNNWHTLGLDSQMFAEVDDSKDGELGPVVGYYAP